MPRGLGLFDLLTLPAAEVEISDFPYAHHASWKLYSSGVLQAILGKYTLRAQKRMGDICRAGLDIQ